MNYRQLLLLVALDEHRNLGRAGAQLNVTTAAASKALRDIERTLDATLFTRGPRGVTPTVYGECMVRHARTVIADLANASTELKALKKGHLGSVSLGLLPTAAPLLAPLGVVELKKKAPYVDVRLREATIDILLPELQLGRLDMIVGNIPSPRFASTLTVEVLIDKDQVAIVSRIGHPLAGRRTINWQHVLEYPWIIPPAGSAMSESFEAHLTKRGHPMARNCVESSSMISNKTIIQSTDSLGFFSRQIARHFADQKAIAVLQFNVGLHIGPIGVMWRKDRPLSPGAQLTVSCLRDAAMSILRRQ
ncbi:MAG TPA: LysR family transcriptional regulator [Dehalococcoidia bacterium]|nr:LysR family transcriptional regulator [Dehalococcoidia bacterium]